MRSCRLETRRDIDQRWENIKKERSVGKSGKSHIPRFSHLHDPLAVYCAMNNCFETEEVIISVHTDNDEMRGAVILMSDKAAIGKHKKYIKGTRVRYLSPRIIEVAEIKKFKEKLTAACGLTLKKRTVIV